MARPKSPRVPKNARPAVDETCTLVRTVETKRVRLALWTCSAPTPVQQGPTGELRPAPLQLIERVGRRKWRFLFVDPAEARREDAWLSEPGWYFLAVNPDPLWISNDPIGPYEALEEALDDLRSAERAE